MRQPEAGAAMTHDPMCPCAVSRHPGCLSSVRCPECRCDLIARVRADERAQAKARVEECPSINPRGTRLVRQDQAATAAGGES